MGPANSRVTNRVESKGDLRDSGGESKGLGDLSSFSIHPSCTIFTISFIVVLFGLVYCGYTSYGARKRMQAANRMFQDPERGGFQLQAPAPQVQAQAYVPRA